MSLFPFRIRTLLTAAAVAVGLWLLCGWLLREAVARHIGAVAGVPASIDSLELAVYPPAVSLGQMTLGPVSGASRSMLTVGQARAEFDLGAGLHWPPVIARLDIEDVTVAPVSVMDQATRLAGPAPASDSAPQAPWDAPHYGQRPDEAAVTAAVDAEISRTRAEVDAFRQALRQRLADWTARSQDPGLDSLASARQTRAEWAALQQRHEALMRSGPAAVETLMGRWGLTEEAWAHEATTLTDDRILGVLQSAIGLRGLLGWTHRLEDNQTVPSLPAIRRVVFSGRLSQGGRDGRLSGEMLNVGGNLEAGAPTTLAVEAEGERLGTLRLTAALERGVPSRIRDTLTLSWQNMRFDSLHWVDRPMVDVVLGDARLSLDISGSLSGEGALDVAVREVWSAARVDVQGRGPDLDLLESLASILQSTPDITVSTIIDGSVRAPEIVVNSEVRDMLLTLIRERRQPLAAALRQPLTSRLQSALDPLVSSAGPELLAVTAFMEAFPATAGERSTPPVHDTQSE
jgi:hypothetical protein